MKPSVTVLYLKSRPEAAKSFAVVEHSPPPPRERPNPLAVAQFWLGNRLEERAAGYFLDGTPADLTRIMRETNRSLKANGQDPITTNPRWLP